MQAALRAPCGPASVSGRQMHATRLVQKHFSSRQRHFLAGVLRPLGVGAEQPQLTRPIVSTQVFPFDQAWAPNVAAASLAPQLFAVSLFPYLAFLYYLTKSGKAPKLMLFGFYFLLAFVGATIPAGIYAKVHYGTSLANVDWLHGAAESLLTVTNLLIVLGLRQGIREAEAAKAATPAASEEQSTISAAASEPTASGSSKL